MPSESIPITLKDGKVRQLRYEWPSLCRLKREHGISAFDVGREQLLGHVDPTKITGLIWAGLIHENKDLTMDEVENLVDITNVMSLMETVGEALLEALHGKEKAEAIKKVIRSSLESSPGKSTSKKATD